MLNPLKQWSQLCRVPHDLSSVTDVGEEASEREAGLRSGSVEALWRTVERLYATGVQPGLQLCVRHRGQVVLDRAIGHARGNAPGSVDLDPVPMTTTTPVNLFSAGKAVTALLMHKLQELGHLDIDAPVADHIDGFGRHGKQRITVRQVMAHRSGVPQLPVPLSAAFESGITARPDEICDLMINAKPQRRIGGAPAYHAISGGFVLAEIMRRTTGREPRDLLATLIKKPLDLSWLDFGVGAEDLHKVAHNAATGWTPLPIGWQLSRVLGTSLPRIVEISNDERFLTAVVPSGNVISTARDTARLYQCLLNEGRLDGQRVFAKETVQRAIKPDRRRASIDRTIGIPMRYSAGFMVGHGGLGLYGWNRTRTYGHLGLTSTLTWARPDTGTVVALLTTGKPVLGPHLAEMLAMFSGFNAFCENRLVQPA